MNATLKKWRNRSIALLLICIVFGSFYIGRISVNVNETATQAQPAAHCESSESPAKPQIYYCSMHPTQQSTNPDDRCPICAMDLIPMPEEDDDDPDAPVLRLSPRAAALMQVAVWPAQHKQVHREVRLFGKLDYDETRLRTITARYPGRLDRLFVNSTGTAVSKGQPLAEIYSPDLITAQEELFQAIAAYEQAAASNASTNANLLRETTAATLDSARQRLRLLGLTPTQIDELETHRQLQDHLTIHAPFDGIVIHRHALEGTYVGTGEPIYAVADLSNLWLHLEVFETDLPWITIGDEAVFTTETWPGKTFSGHITFIDPVLNAQSRTARLRVEVPNEKGLLKPGMLVRAAVHAVIGDDSDEPLVIPATAPLITGQRSVVYVQIPDDERLAFEGRHITLGLRAGEYYTVTDGLEAGELVVTNGAFMIDSELQIRGRPSMMQNVPAIMPDGDQPAQPRLPQYQLIAAPAHFVQSLTPIFDHYINLQTALADDDLDTARQAAAALHEAVSRIDAADLDRDAQDLWRVIAARLDTDQEHITHDNIDQLRQLFQTYSISVIELAARFGCADCNELVIAYCPMAFDDTGAHWIQRGNAIANPYFGAAMYRCGDVIQPITASEDQSDSDSDSDTPQPDASSAFLAALDPLYQAYFTLQNALADDDFAASKHAALAFHDHVRAIDDTAPPPQWSALRDQLLTDADTCAEVSDIETLRQMFEPWAMAMIDASKAFGHAADDGHFIAYCPMAFDWKGAAWLQADNVINNPYFGATMLRCGNIREQIQPRGHEEGGH